MKKSRLFTALLVMLVAASGFAQDSYQQAAKEYFALNGGFKSLEEAASGFKQGTMFLFKSGDLNLSQLTDRYFEEALPDYVINMMIPKIKELGVTEEDLRGTSALLSTPEGKAYIDHSQQWTEVLKSELLGYMTKNQSKFMNGEIVDPVQPDPGIDAEYIEKFKKVIEPIFSKGFKQSYESYWGYLMGLYEKVGVNLPDMTEKMGKMNEWMTANVPTMAVNTAYGIMTLDDIDFSTKLYSSSTYDKMHGLINMLEIESVGSNMLTNYVEWMQEHGAVLQDNAIEILNRFK